MIFRACSIGGVVFEDAMNGQLRQEMINKAVKLQKSESQDFNVLYEAKVVFKIFISNNFKDSDNNPLRKDIEYAREFLLALALCNTIIVDNDQSSNGGDSIYRAQSPDEGALVKAAKINGFKLAANTSTGKIIVILFSSI
jgi:magnesium-transporting ATPase (P-type)